MRKCVAEKHLLALYVGPDKERNGKKSGSSVSFRYTPMSSRHLKGPEIIIEHLW